MTSRIILLCGVLNIYVGCVKNSFNHIEKSGLIDGNVSWFATKITRYSALRYEMNISFILRKEICCPIVHLFSDYEDRYHHIDKLYHGHNDVY